ncbi:MAG: FG-GAP repeat domain-containing protein [Nitrospirota bacterium]
MKIYLILTVLLLTLIPLPAPAEKPLGVEEFTSVEELAVSISSYFPKVQGEVKDVQGDRLTLALSKKDGLMPGMVLTLWRDGKDILHPVTGAVIGRAEEEVGTAEVTSVADTSSTAVVKKKLKDPKSGDKARITPRKINIALLPLRADHPEVIQRLAERLNEFGRFSVLGNEKVAVFIKDRKERDSTLVKEMGTVFGLDAVISLGIYPSSDGKQMVTARIFYTEDASQLDTIVAMLDLKAGKQALGEIRPFFVPLKNEKRISPELPFIARYFVAGDFDGGGNSEYAFLDAARLHIYRLEPTGWREVWTETTPAANPSSDDPAAGIQYINLDAADMDGDGRPELFITAMLEGKVTSYVMKFQDGTFRRIAEIPGFLRIINYPGRGVILIGQDYDPVKFFAGKPKQYTWSGGKYVPGPELPLPKGLTLYGFTFADFGEQNPLLVAFDDEDRVIVYAKDAPLWKSAEKYTVVNAYVYKPVTGIAAAISKPAAEADNKSRRVRLRGRILALDFNNDGKDEILLPKNIGESFLSAYSGAELHGLRWTGARLDEAWGIKDLPGPVIDFQVVRQDQNAAQIITLVKIKGGFFSKDREQVMIFSVK